MLKNEKVERILGKLKCIGHERFDIRKKNNIKQFYS